jgi:hypothetical protein
VQHHASARSDADRQCIGNGVIDREKFKVEGPERVPGAGRHLCRDRGDAVLGEFAADQAEGQLGADQRAVIALAEQVGHRAAVILVGMGEDDRLDIAQPHG